MAKTGADVLVETVMNWGVDVVFGLPGDGITPRGDRIRRLYEARSKAKLGEPVG
jgi:thiamine pyrophosphate-dependent acetolactate synthase large subunit-like protein